MCFCMFKKSFNSNVYVIFASDLAAYLAWANRLKNTSSVNGEGSGGEHKDL